MGFGSTQKYILKGVRKHTVRKFHRQQHHHWDTFKNLLDALIRYQRIETTLPRAKELQQYAEEIVHFAKKDTPESDLIVESMLRTPQARRILYEKMVPRYGDRHFYVTRIVNQWRFRMRDSTPMAFIEFVDRPGELRPANPVGWERAKYIWEQMQQTRRGYRRYSAEAAKLGVIDEEGKLLPDINLLPKNTKYDWQPSEDEAEGLTSFDPQQQQQQQPSPSDKAVSTNVRNLEFWKHELAGPKRALLQFFVDLPPPSAREAKEMKAWNGFFRKF